jgi:hypothetical protein
MRQPLETMARNGATALLFPGAPAVQLKDHLADPKLEHTGQKCQTMQRKRIRPERIKTFEEGMLLVGFGSSSELHAPLLQVWGLHSAVALFKDCKRFVPCFFVLFTCTEFSEERACMRAEQWGVISFFILMSRTCRILPKPCRIFERPFLRF